MDAYNNAAFTETITALYAEKLKSRFPMVKFVIDEQNAVADALANRQLFRIIRAFGPSETTLELDGYMRGDGSVREEYLVGSFADFFFGQVSQVLASEMAEEENDPLRIGAGQVWVVHKKIAAVDTGGRAQTHFAVSDTAGIFGQTWFDQSVMKTKFLGKTECAVARHGETKKEDLDVNALRNEQQ